MIINKKIIENFKIKYTKCFQKINYFLGFNIQNGNQVILEINFKYYDYNIII